MGSTAIQAEFAEDHYPIGRFILERARSRGMSRGDLVHRLGYPDIDSGHKALTAALLNGSVAPHHLAEALEADDALVRSVIGATMRQKSDEARLGHPLWKLQDAIKGQKRQSRVENERAYCASFRQDLQVQTERTVPSPIFVAAMLTVARLRSIPLPDDALATNDEARDRLIKPIIMDHWRENNRRVPAFGGITGYVLVSVAGYGGFDFGLPFSVAGDRAGAMQKVERLGEATLRTRRGDMSLTGLLKNSPIRVV
jgi:hypothetical protein